MTDSERVAAEVAADNAETELRTAKQAERGNKLSKLIRSACSVARRRCCRPLSEDERQAVAVLVCQRAANKSARKPGQVVWRAAGDWLVAERKRLELAELQAELIELHNVCLSADRRHVESLPVGGRYNVAGRYGRAPNKVLTDWLAEACVEGSGSARGTTFPALPYETESVCRWARMNAERVTVELAAGVVSDKVRVDTLGKWFAARQDDATEVAEVAA